MKSLYQTALLLLSATVPLASCAEEPIRDMTVTMCPASSMNEYCSGEDPIVIKSPEKEEGPTPPAFSRTFGAFAMMYEADYELSWVSSNDEAIEMDIVAGNYSHKPVIKHGQHSYTFCLKDLARQMYPARIEADTNAAILGSIAALQFRVLMSHPSANNVSYIVMSEASVMTASPYRHVTDSMEIQYAQGKKDNYNKWKLGVGIGVGLGVPILMALSFFLGARRSSRKASARSNKQIDHELTST